jgi:hypothetical protein
MMNSIFLPKKRGSHDLSQDGRVRVAHAGDAA